jgi:hypothetical protein
MRNKLLQILLTKAFAILILFTVTVFSIYSVVFAGEYHNQSDVLCSDCHTTHYSERGTLPERAEPGGPFPEMLLVSSVDKLCLACHDGTDPDAPDVLAPVVMYNGSGSEFSGAGYFTGSDGFVSGMGHDLGIESQVPYSTSGKMMTLSCISCHDPHGTSNFRNLVLNPDSVGSEINLTLNSDVFENINPSYPPERSVSIEAYRSGNIGYRANISEWCLDCHNALSNDTPGNPPAHFIRHPWETAISGLGNHTNSTHWTNGVGDGFGAATGDGVEGVPRLRFQSPTATNFNSAVLPGASNQVFCTTCHFSHGGPYESSLTWPYKTNGTADLYSGCQQCHYK